MNPLPNRPLLNNANLPLTLPNVPSFEPMAYNGRPRKVMPEGKEFPMLNGMSMLAGPSSTSAQSSGQMSSLERSNSMNSMHSVIPLQPQPPLGQMQSQSSQQPPQGFSHTQQGQQQQQQQLSSEKDKDGESEPRQYTAIFRPEDPADWKEKLRQSHADRLIQMTSDSFPRAGAWDKRGGEEDDGKEEEPEVDEDDATAVGEGDGTKIWKAKRTLRKSVMSIVRVP
jgi:striatin 1/3/4